MRSDMMKTCVIGSLNSDLTIFIPRFHVQGETITGSEFHIYTGGKGGNQAVALARLGADVAMVGALGDDANGKAYMDALKREGVDDRLLRVCPDIESGVALIEVCVQTGDNRIAISAGANGRVDCEYIDGIWQQLLERELFLLQLETPIETVEHAAVRLSEAGKTVILDPAPARPLSDALIAASSYITPNETELQMLTGMPTDTDAEIEAAARMLIGKGARAVIAKMGKRGAMLVKPEGWQRVAGFKVDAVDSTAAGDSFNAGFAYALAQGWDELLAVRFANAVGALSTTAAGAQAAMPKLERVNALLNQSI